MNRKVFKIIIIFLILLFLEVLIINNSFAWDAPIDEFEDSATDAGSTGNKVVDIMGAVINITSTVAAGIAIIMLISMGIRYVSSGAAGKAETKKDLQGYITGAVILFGVSGILKLIQKFVDANLN